MKNHPFYFTSLAFTIFAGCAPNLIVKTAMIHFDTQTVDVTLQNIGNKAAPPHLTYVEINAVGAPDASKPQSQFSWNVATEIPPGGTLDSNAIPFSSFSSPRGLNLSTLTALNLVVRADAKNMVQESNENDNILDRNY